MKWIDGIKSRKIVRIPHKKCVEGDFEASSEFIRNSGLICVNDFDQDAKLKGNYLSDEFRYLRLKFELCPEYSDEIEEECSPLEEIKNYLDNLYINIAIFKAQFKLGGDLESSFML